MTGLNSVTFRPLSWQQILQLAAENNLDCIEWGGDVHVSPGDEALAKRVGEATRKAGLATSAYGSYYRLGEEENEENFPLVLQAAKALGAPLLRIWPGTKGSAQTTKGQRAALTEELKTICRQAAAQNITIGLEYHRNTLTDTAASTLQLLTEANAPNLKTYWQMNPELTHPQRMEEIASLRPHICAVHVFYWTPKTTRHPLSQGAQMWQAYLQALNLPQIPHTFEFVQNDTEFQLKQDIKCWKKIQAQL